jgi:hypothetical protein
MMLWDDAGSQGQALSRGAIRQAIKKNCINHIPEATLTFFAADNGNGTAVVVCPRGGYSGVYYGREGILISQWLNRLGITAFVLKYRLPREGENCLSALFSFANSRQYRLSILFCGIWSTPQYDTGYNPPHEPVSCIP